MTSSQSQGVQSERPVDRYLLGVHHLAQPTIDPKATLDFYVDVMGAKITHCVSSRGWRPKHYDYIHMFLDLGRGGNIAMFYYFGVKDPKDWPKYGSHHSFAANSLEELQEWADWLEANGHRIKMRNTYEVMSSIYVWDPNGRWFEIAANHRELGPIDAEDAELTARALVIAAAEGADTIGRMWQIKADLVQEQEREVDGPALIYPDLDEFDWIPAAAGDTAGEITKLGNFTALAAADDRIALTKPADLPESLWWTCGTGGVKGAIEEYDEQRITIR